MDWTKLLAANGMQERRTGGRKPQKGRTGLEVCTPVSPALGRQGQQDLRPDEAKYKNLYQERKKKKKKRGEGREGARREELGGRGGREMQIRNQGCRSCCFKLRPGKGALAPLWGHWLPCGSEAGNDGWEGGGPAVMFQFSLLFSLTLKVDLGYLKN